MLDVIVEKEIDIVHTDERQVHIPGGWLSIDLIGRRIAERAFRHGVEQALTKGVDMAWNVQPAPAEHVCSYGCSLTGHGPPGNRRKGERRKGPIHRTNILWTKPTDGSFPVGTRMWNDDTDIKGNWFVERRHDSHGNRRKP